MIILGIDPGLQKTGYGVIQKRQNHLTPIKAGVIKPDVSLPLSERLGYLHQELLDVIKTYTPSEVAIEEVFVNKNPLSTLKLGMARGVLLMTPSLQGIPVYEYSANLVKKSVVGSGHANKDQIMMMIKTLLPTLQNKLTTDSADALAIAICHSHHQNFHNLKIANL